MFLEQLNVFFLTFQTSRVALVATSCSVSVRNLVAIPSTPLIPADSRTTADHNYKYKNISSSSSQHKHSLFPRTIVRWKSLNRPKDIAESSSLDIFKSRLS